MGTESALDTINAQLLELRDAAQKGGVTTERFSKLLQIHAEDVEEKGYGDSGDQLLKVREEKAARIVDLVRRL